MKSALKDLPVINENAQRVSRATAWGGMEVYTAEIHETHNHTLSSDGLPDEDCQCPHWGYVLKGQLRVNVAGQEELFNGGDLFYLPPGHSVISEVADSQYIILMPSDEWAKEVAKRDR